MRGLYKYLRMKKICCIGHITLDKIITPKSEVEMPGGTSFYFAHGIHNLNPDANFQLVTAVAQSEMKSVDDIRALGVDVVVLPTRHTVFFENKYGENQNNRTQRVLAKADPFTAQSLQGIEADIYHLGSLLADDFSLDVFEMLSAKGTLSVDAQGYLREVRGEKVYPIDWKNKRDYLRYVDILKVNEYEIESLGSYGSVIYDGSEFAIVPAFPTREVVDATGCGDTYSTGYLYKRACGASIADAGCFAAAMSSLKLEHSGPFSRTEVDIENLLKTSGLTARIEK